MLRYTQWRSYVNCVYDSKAERYAEDNRIELYAPVNPNPK